MMNKSESKNSLKPDDRQNAPISINKNEKQNNDDDEDEWWASDSGSSTGSYYSDTDR